jgi:hypothetical protein
VGVQLPTSVAFAVVFPPGPIIQVPEGVSFTVPTPNVIALPRGTEPEIVNEIPLNAEASTRSHGLDPLSK